jgi:hypothetical protein
MFDMNIQIGQRVRHISTGEVGIVVHVWIDPETDAEDAYVAFFGRDFPAGKPAEIPYVLRYFTSSLEPVA